MAALKRKSYQIYIVPKNCWLEKRNCRVLDFLLKNGTHWKSRLFTGDLHAFRYQDTARLYLGVRMTGLLFVWRSPGWRSCRGLLSLFTLPFCRNFPEGWMRWTIRGFGYFLMVALSQIFLGSLLSKAVLSPCSSLARPNLLLTLGSYCSPWRESLSLASGLVCSVVSAPVDSKSKKPLYTEAYFQNVS